MCVVPVSTFRVNGALLVLPLRVYRLTWYLVPGCRPFRKTTTKKMAKQVRNTRITGLLSWKLWCTCDRVGLRRCWEVSSDGGMWASHWCGLDEVTSDGFRWFGAPGQSERCILPIRDTHAPRRTYVCIEEKGKQKLNRAVGNNWWWLGICTFMVLPLTFQCGRLPLQRSAGDRVLQSIDGYLVGCCHLRNTNIQLIFTHWLTLNPCTHWN